MRQVPSQHGGVHPGEGVPPEEPAYDPPPGPADERTAAVRTDPQEGKADGTPDPEPASAEGIHLPSGGTVPGVSTRCPVVIVNTYSVPSLARLYNV